MTHKAKCGPGVFQVQSHIQLMEGRYGRIEVFGVYSRMNWKRAYRYNPENMCNRVVVKHSGKGTGS